MQRTFFLFFCIILAACSSGDAIPADIIPVDKMKIITWDIMRAGEYAQRKFGKDSAVIKLKTTESFQQVFKIYGISKEDYYKSFSYYESHPDKNQILFDSLSAYADRQRQQLLKKIQ